MKNKILFLLLLIANLLSQDSLVYSIPIHGDIDMGLPYYIERGIIEAEENNAQFILFDIETFGGRVDAATRIKDAILSSKIPTIAFVNRRAISAGALISLSCDSIYMAIGGTIGAATAVDQSGKKASEKVISYMREEMASTAEANNRNRDVAAAMVDEELEISFIMDVSGDTLTVKDVSGFKSGKLITLSTELALRLKIADRTFETRTEILDYLLPSGWEVVEVKVSWSEQLVRFLTSPTVAPLLMSLGLLGLFFEIKSPGFGFPGAFGLICLGLFFGSHLLVGLADVFEIILLISGIALILLEVFVVPGFGITGISGIALILYSMYKMLLAPHPGPGEGWEAYYGMNIGIIVMFITGIIFFKALTKSNLYHKFIPISSQKKSDGFSISKGYDQLKGKTGKTISKLRPSGKALIDGKEYQVMSHGEFIEAGADVLVDGVDENQILVKTLDH
ncbi:MAG: nodulation protein NfeD [Candidatus Marinimicrobia bacterium]|nr:nodulation protein NfeD [Candidatus Neomarinimicrobiota bacterium]